MAQRTKREAVLGTNTRTSQCGGVAQTTALAVCGPPTTRDRHSALQPQTLRDASAAMHLSRTRIGHGPIPPHARRANS